MYNYLLEMSKALDSLYNSVDIRELPQLQKSKAYEELGLTFGELSNFPE